MKLLQKLAAVVVEETTNEVKRQIVVDDKAIKQVIGCVAGAITIWTVISGGYRTPFQQPSVNNYYYMPVSEVPRK